MPWRGLRMSLTRDFPPPRREQPISNGESVINALKNRVFYLPFHRLAHDPAQKIVRYRCKVRRQVATNVGMAVAGVA